MSDKHTGNKLTKLLNTKQMKQKTAKQKINALVNKLQAKNQTQIGIVLLNDLLLKSAIKQREQVIKERHLNEKNFISPQVFIDVYDIIINELENN